MKRTLLLIAAGLAAVAAIAIAVTYPALGHWVYRDGGQLEARLSGFHREQIAAGDVTFSVYRGGTHPGRETIVLLHGYSADKQVWVRFAKHLLDRYEVIVPDLAGHGDTGFVHGLDYSAPAQARRVAAMLDSLHIERAHLAGNSMGGFITAHFALAYPQRTLSAGLIDPAGVSSPEPSDMGKLLATGRNPFEVHSRAEFDAFYAMTMAQPPWLPGFVLAAMAESYQQRRPALTEIFQGFHNRDALDGRLAEIPAPTLVLWGDQDRLIHVSAARVWAAGLPKATLVIREGIGHMPMVEQPAETAAIYRDFLASLTP
ncbi:alpha/beta fold hydrolase [Stagnimonas aquatica]|uniref:Alpha/beta fold hydrolase n=1 Tax=Stagnimonas aquatica TaxID=2689987 RepID=A0A3N0V1W7_9GAMM|nr:alpha/beta fold hydrolase [Stagnimonas aquatica]ROH86703.1 alpha/beta fold hydrolase [Stagnimonas aquatica]